MLRPTTIPAFFDPALILPIANLPGHLSPATLSAFFDPALLTEIKGHSGCYGGPVPYKTTGYLEGAGGYIMLGQLGKEVTYDFAFMQRQLFKYSGIGVSDAAAGVGYAEYFGFANGFRSNVEISTDYRGPFILVPGGVSGTIPPFADIGIGLGIGGVAFSAPNGSIYGTSFYLGINLAGDPLPFIDIGVAYVTYEAEPPINPPPYFNADGTVDLTRLVRDIRSGTDSPWRTGALASIQWIARDIAISSATYLAKVHDEIYVNSSL